MKQEQLVGRLPLTNSGELQTFFFGVGSASAIKHFQNNFVIIKGNQHISVDLGNKSQLALEHIAGLKMTDIEFFLPTHSHADHVGGIETFALDSRYVGIPRLGKEKPSVIITEEYQRILWDDTLRGGICFNEREEENKRNLCFGDYFNVIRPIWKQKQPREIWELDLGGIHLEIFRTKHVPDSAETWETSFVSYGLFVDGHVFISCDTRFDIDLINMYASRSSVMFHDVQFFNGGVHASLDELRTLPAEIKAKMYLMHYGDNWETQDITGFAGLAQQGVIYTP